MRYATSGAFRSALERRLLTTAQESGVPLARLRKLVVFDRLMARMLAVSPDRWMLKGAVALDYRLRQQFRSTKDLDLGRQDNEEAATADLLAAVAIDLGDFFVFAIERVRRNDDADGVPTARYRAVAQLAGRRFEEVVIDIGFGDPIIATADMLSGPDLLSFAGIDPVETPAIPIAQHVAEKVHAYTRSYTGNRPSSRVKDLIDLVLIRAHVTLSSESLHEALNATFARRATHPLSASLPQPPSMWTVAYRRLANEVGIDPQLALGFNEVAAFLNPILGSAVVGSAVWNPARGAWEAPADHPALSNRFNSLAGHPQPASGL